MSTPPRILFALDLDDDTERVFTGARPILDRLAGVVDLLHVETASIAAFVDAGALTILLSAAAEREAGQHQARLQDLLDLVPAERRGQVVLAWNRATAEELVERASSHDLLVVVTHARQGIRRAWLGSVAEKVVRSSPVPVLVLGSSGVPDPGPEPRVLVPVDLQDEVGKLLREAGHWATALGGKVDLVSVLPTYVPLALGGWRPGPGWQDDLAASTRAAGFHLQDRLGFLAEEVRGTTRVAQGDPAEEILARVEGHAMLIVGTHGRKGSARFWLGSVAERIVRLSPVPVLVVPTGARD